MFRQTCDSTRNYNLTDRTDNMIWPRLFTVDLLGSRKKVSEREHFREIRASNYEVAGTLFWPNDSAKRS